MRLLRVRVLSVRGEGGKLGAVVGCNARALLVGVCLVGCASGGGDGDNPIPMVANTQGSEGSEGGDVLTTGISASATQGESGQGSTGEGDSTTTGAAQTSTGDSTSTGEPVEGSSSSGGSTGDDTGMPPACVNALTCPTATVLGMVSGDESSPSLEADGSEPTWLAFQVTEDNDSALGEDLSFTATLQSPPGYDFDLYVYRGADGASNGCNGTLQQSTAASGMDVVSMSWGEGAVANGGDDRRWIAVEIVAKNDMCDPGATWTLTIDGDN